MEGEDQLAEEAPAHVEVGNNEKTWAEGKLDNWAAANVDGSAVHTAADDSGSLAPTNGSNGKADHEFGVSDGTDDATCQNVGSNTNDVDAEAAAAAAVNEPEEPPPPSADEVQNESNEMIVERTNEENGEHAHAVSNHSKSSEEPSKPSEGASEGALESTTIDTKEEDSQTTFDCPEAECGGKLMMNEDFCRFGHGLVVRCTGGKGRHKFKWCNEHYTFVPAHEWPVHLSWCYEGAKDHVRCVDASQLEQFAARSSAVPAAQEEDHNGSAESAHAGGKRKEPENGRRRSARSAAEEKDGAGRQEEEEEDDRLQEEVRAILKENRRAILCGDSAQSRQWRAQLRELRGKSLVLEMQTRASLSAEKSDAAGMFFSAMRGDLDRLSALIAQGGDVNAADKQANLPLHWAAAAGSVEVGRLLLDAGADANARGAGGATALHVAAGQGRAGFLQLLLARGADVDAANDEGLSARHLLNVLAESTLS